MYVWFVHSALENEGGEVRLVYEGTYCLAWGVTWTKGEIGVLSVSSLFLTRVGVYVGVGVCTRTHTHTHCTYGVLGCEPRGRENHLEGPNPDGPNLGIHVFVYVYKVHMCMYMPGGEMRSRTGCFFL